MIDSLPPFIIFFFGAILIGLTPARLRPIVSIAIPVVGLLNMLTLTTGQHASFLFLDLQLVLLRVDKLSILFGWLFHIATLLGVIYALHIKDSTQQIAAIIYAGSALGAVFSGDLLSLFMFWEMLALSSVFLIWARRTHQAFTAGLRYLIIQILSGVILMAGVLIRLHETGDISFTFIGLEGLAGWLIFIAFGIKCAFPFLHNWLTDAYPEATPTGTVFLSAFTTKVAVYALARGYPGTDLLIYIGVAMTCFPIFYAVIENDLRRVLSYSMINQIGFMVCGIGIGTQLAVNGAVSHAFNDVIFKGLLMMSMGAVLYRTGKINGSELGGLYKSMPKTTVLCIIGAASISAFPLFSGFVSKSMVMTAALEEGHDWMWLMLLFASAGVFHHAGIKIPFFAFFAHDAGIRVQEAPRNMLVAMTLAAIGCVYIGVFPWTLYALLPYPVIYAPFDTSHVITQLQLLFFSALAFTWLKLSGIYPPELASINIDTEWAYRKLAPGILTRTHKIYAFTAQICARSATQWSDHVINAIKRLHATNGALARTRTTGNVTIIALFVFAVFLYWNYAR